jgi:hypothetical protein
MVRGWYVQRSQGAYTEGKMSEWVSAAKVVEQYAVSEARLLEYSARGNLPCRRAADGDADHDAVYFDLAYVARIFRRRNAPLPQRAEASVLGRVTLGQKLVRAARAPR